MDPIHQFHFMKINEQPHRNAEELHVAQIRDALQNSIEFTESKKETFGGKIITEANGGNRE